MLGVGEDLSGKVYYDLADPRKNVRRDIKDAHAEYHLFGLSDMNIIENVLGDVMKLEHMDTCVAALYNMPFRARFLLQKKGRARREQGRFQRGQV